MPPIPSTPPAPAIAELSTPLVIPLFIPHEGCPHSCVFCNQRQISGQQGNPVTAEQVQAEIRIWLDRAKTGGAPGRRVQAAFYGGSFTGLPKERQEELLSAVAPFMAQGRVHSIRVSTRPDYITREKTELIRAHHVGTVELGVQSMDNRILVRAQRGHTAADVVQAVPVLRRAGMRIGLQLMLGLPGDNRAGLRKTVEQTIALEPDFVRIYPLLVLRRSALAQLYAQGRYTPLSLNKAVLLAAWMKERFDRAGIPVIRMGLQAGSELEASLVAGPWHPAFGELVASRLMLNRTRKLLSRIRGAERACVCIHEKDQSVFRGIRSGNITRLRQLGLWRRIVLKTDPNRARGTVGLDALF